MTIAPARDYAPAADLAVITSYFNPAGFVSKRKNYEQFAGILRASGLHLTTVDCAMSSAPFQLPISRSVIRVRASSVMWHKERLLNIAIGTLPSQYTKIAWLDADVLFSNPAWAVETSRALDDYTVIQPYSQSIRLPPATTSFEGRGLVEESFCSRIALSPHSCTVGSWELHGQTGFAWAARREALVHGLYDRAIAGGADHIMAHAFAGDWESECISGIMLGNQPYDSDYRAWSVRVYRLVRARLGFIEGHLLHLWHGSLANRRYRDRACDLAALNYDPSRDIRLGPSRCWEWTGKNEALQRWCRKYFDERREDTRPGQERQERPSRRDLLSRIRRYRDRAENAELAFWVDAACSAERAVLRAQSVLAARRVADDFFDWCADEAAS